MIRKASIIFASAVLCLCSCSKDAVTPEPPMSADVHRLNFSIGMGQGPVQDAIVIDSLSASGMSGSYIVRTSGESIEVPQTKAAPISDLSTYGTFCLYGYIYSSWNNSVKPEYMLAEKVSWKNSSWTTENAFNNKIGEKKLRFYGYAPYGATGVAVPSNTAGPLGFSYTVPSAVADQNDLLVGASGEYTGELSNLSMSFGHCLSAVTFKTGTETVDGTIKSIALKGIYTKGNYVYGSGWSSRSTKGNFSYSSNISVSEGSSKTLTSGAATMMLIPQTVPSGATIEVVIESEGKTNTLSASIAGDTWAEGKKCVYSLSFDSIAGMHITLDVSSLTLEWGESKDIAVTGNPSDQNWTKVISGTGLTAEKINNTTLRVTNNNISGTDSNGLLTVTTEDKRREAQVSILAKSLQESISLSPTSKTIAYNTTETFTASGTFPNGFSLNSPSGVAVSKSGNTISVKNTTSSYTAKDITLTATTALMSKSASASIHLSAKPETISLDKSSLTVGNSGSGTVKASGNYDSFTATLSNTEYASVSVSGNTITITNKNISYESKTITLTVKTSGDTGATASVTITLEPMEDYVIDYTITSLSLDKSSVPASGGKVTVSGGKVTQVWASGKKVENYASATLTVSRTSQNSSYPASVSGSTVTVSSLGTNIVSEGTYTISAAYSKDGITAEGKTAQFTQSENKITNSNYSPSSTSYKAEISIGDGLSAAGGSATITFRAYHNAKNQYSSGATDASYHTEYDPATVTISSNGNSSFSLSGTTTQTGDGATCTLNHSNMTTNVRTDNVTVKVTNNNKTTKTATASKSVSNSLLDQHYKNKNGTTGDNISGDNTLKSRGTPTISIGSGLTAAGGSATVTASVKDTYTGTTTTTWYQKYSSGSWSDLKSSTTSGDYEQDGEVTLSITTNGNNRFSLSGKTLSHSNMTTNETTDNVTVKAVNKNSTGKYATASKSVTNNRYTGTSATKNHTRTGSVSYGSKTYGSTTYGSKSYGSEYVKSTDYGAQVTDSDTYGSWSTYSTSTDKYDYAVSFAVTSWSPGSDATNKANAITAYHYERSQNEQRRTITHNYHQSYTQHYYRDYTRSASRSYTRTASQNCNYIEYRTDSFDSGSTLYVEENKSHTETWTDSGTESLSDDTGSDWYRDATGTSYGTSDGGYDYRTTYGTGSKKTDTVTPSSDKSWLSWSSGTMYVTANNSSDSRSATLTVTNGTASASCSVTQSGAEYDIVIN